MKAYKISSIIYSSPNRKIKQTLFFLTVCCWLTCLPANSTEDIQLKNNHGEVVYEFLLDRFNEIKSQEPSEVISKGMSLIDDIKDESLAFQKLKVDILNQISRAHLISGDYSSSLLKAKEAKSISLSIEYKQGIGAATKNIAHFYLFLNDYETALSHYFQAIEYVNEPANNLERIKLLNSIAQVYYKIGKYTEAIDIFNESIGLLSSTNDKRNLAYAYGGLAETYSLYGDLEKSLHYIELSISLLIEIDDQIGLVISNRLMGNLQLKLGQLEKARSFFEASIDISRKNELHAMMLGPLNNLAVVSMLKNDFVQAKELATDVLQQAEQKKERIIQAEVLDTLSQIATKEQDYKLALEYFKRQKTIENEIFNEKSDRNIAALRTSFEVEKLDKQNQMLIHKNELNEANLEKQRIQSNFLVVFLLLVLSLIGFIYYRYDHNRKLHHQKMLNEQLHRLDGMKDRILMNTSHEFRTPLAGIIGLADCLREEILGPQSDEAKEHLDIIINSGNRLTSLVEDIINFAQLKNGEIKLMVKPLDLYPLVVDIVTACTPLLANKSISIINDIPAGTIRLIADEKRLSQILFNLIGNAIKYSEQGDITINARQHTEFIKVNVIDRGIGIPADKLPHIFECFEQVDSSDSRSQQGSGLGLAIAKRLVEVQGGELTVTSKVRIGSTFSFTLPCAN